MNRKLPLLLQYQDNTYEALSLAIYRKYLNNPPITLVSSDSYDFESRLEGIQIESFNIPVDNSGTILIPYRGLQGSFRYISITDILNGEVEEELLQGKIAIMGLQRQDCLTCVVRPYKIVTLVLKFTLIFLAVY